MYHIDHAISDSKAPMTFYENTKRNAVAAKITETAVSTLKENITTEYLENVFGVVFDDANSTADRINEIRDASTIEEQLQGLRDTLDAYDRAISSFNSNSDSTRSGIRKAETRLAQARAQGRASVRNAKSDLARAQKTVNELRTAIHSRTDKLKKELETLSDLIDRIKANPLDKALRKDAVRRADVILNMDISDSNQREADSKALL
jgi:putative membrane protein